LYRTEKSLHLSPIFKCGVHDNPEWMRQAKISPNFDPFGDQPIKKNLNKAMVRIGKNKRTTAFKNLF